MSSRLIRLPNLISVCALCLLTLGSPLTAAPLTASKPPQDEAVEVSVIRLRADGTSVSERSVRLASPADCPLPPPALIAPVNGVRVNTLIPVFDWSNTGTSRYRIQVSEVSDFSTMTINGWLGGYQGGFRPWRNLSANTTYFWRMASVCADYSAGEFSATASFSTANITGPFLDPPLVMAPPDGAVFGSLSVPFSWGDVPGAVTWQLNFYRSFNDAQSDGPSFGIGGCIWNDSATYTFSDPGTYYWRIRVRDDTAWGTLSPIRSITVGAGNEMEVDIGFRPYPDGFRFPNWGGSFPGWPTPLNPDFRKQDLARMFGYEAVCWKDIGPACVLRTAAVQWWLNANRELNSGRCDGLTTTSLRFFNRFDTPSDFQTGAQSTHDLDQSSVRHHISYYWVLQIPNPVAQARSHTVSESVEQVFDRLQLGMSGAAVDPTTLIFYRQEANGQFSGHSVTPYAIEDRGNGQYWVWVYDNNYPEDHNRRVEINTVADTWSYDMGGRHGIWSGGGDWLGAIAISTYAQQPECPWCDGVGVAAVAQPSRLQTSISGHGNLLIADSQGRRIGFVGGQFVNEIPDAFGSVIPGGLGLPANPVYHLPISDTYVILLDGQTLTQTETAEVTQFGPGYAAWFESITVGPTTQDHLTIATDGKQLVYAPNEAQEAMMGFALDDATATRKLQIHGAEVGAGQVVTLTADVDQGHLVFDNTQTGGGQYSIDIQQTSDTGEHRFIHADVSVSAGDTHYVGYGAWAGEGTVQLGIDYGSDGIINETVELDNQTVTVYLPLVLRNR